MKNIPGRSSAAWMIVLSLTIRLFRIAAVDFPDAGSAAWLCPLVGLLFALPLVLACSRAARLSSDSPISNLCSRCPAPAMCVVQLLLFALLLLDCASNMRLLAGTANVLALGSTPLPLLLLPLALLLGISVYLGADAAGSSALIFLRILPFLGAAVIAVQFSSYEPGWLTPALGSGIKEIAQCGLCCSGAIALLILPWFFSVPDRNKRSSPFLYLLFAALAASAMLALQQMLAPAQLSVPLSRSSRIELILSNGRTSLSIQMLMMLL